MCFPVYQLFFMFMQASFWPGGGATFQEGVIDLLIRGGEYWFLYTIFFIYLIFPVIVSICDKNTFSCAVGLCVVILGASIDVTTDLFLINRVLQYLPYFYVGWLLRKEVNKGVSRFYLHYWPLGVILVAFLLKVNVSNKTYLKSFTMALGFCYTLIGFLYSTNNCKWFSSIAKCESNYVKRFILICGRYSLQLYLFNMYLQVLIRIVICSVLGISNAFLIIAVGSALNFIVILPICSVLEKHTSILKCACGL